MKTNEAPEKIYVDSKAIGDGISTTVHTERQDYSTCTEYVRTDSFVKKAEEYIYKQLNEGRIECGDIEKFIKDFRRYMEGE